MEQPYTNPRVPVHIITGAAGSSEVLSPFHDWTKDWSALRVLEYGYARMKVFNATHLYLEEVSGDTIVDSFWLIQEKHGPFPSTYGESQPEDNEIM